MKTYEKNGVKVTLNKNLALKIDSLVKCGLVKGMGQPEEGKMCVESAAEYTAKSAEYAADRYLTIAADIYLEVLTEMNCPGVELLKELE